MKVVRVAIARPYLTATRDHAMRPSLQEKMHKMLEWEQLPGYDYYIWLDANIDLNVGSVEWFVRQCEGYHMAAFIHPDNESIYEELLHTERLTQDVFADVYGNEPMREQVEMYLSDKEFVDDHMYALGAFIYENTELVRKVFKEWFLHCARYSIQDQLSFPYVIRKLSVHGLNNLMENKYLQWYPTNYDVMCIKERQ